MKLVVAGANGRMGKALIRLIHEREDVVLHAALEHPASPILGQDAGVLAGLPPLGILVGSDPLTALLHADGLIDFTTPASTVALAEIAAQARIVHVVGTTGCSMEDEMALKACARHAVLIKSGNMSLGVNLLAALVRRAAQALDIDFDIEIVEMHHRHKVDAPSGTALLLGKAAAAGRGITLEEAAIYGRHGITSAREPGALGFASLRGGSVVGDHSVIFAGSGERITLAHQAEDRAIFARGALTAALWGRGKRPGLYTMAEVLGLDE